MFLSKKWFYQRQNNFHCYFLIDEDGHYRTVRHKPHMNKMMLFAVLTEDRYIADKGKYWDRKIGCYTIEEEMEAKCTSKYYKKEKKIKSISMTREVFAKSMEEKSYLTPYKNGPGNTVWMDWSFQKQYEISTIMFQHM